MIRVPLAALVTCLLLPGLWGCRNPVESPPPSRPDSLLNYHRTEHFVFLYDASAFTRQELEANGKAKEAHLARIIGELGVEFDKEILVRLLHESGEDWIGQASPQEPYFIQETRDYFVRDDGHEIAHVVSFETMGFPSSLRFFVEGLAAAHELDAYPKWHRICRVDMELVEAKLPEMLEASSSFDVDYRVAAAYVEWLEQVFGMERFKAFYRDLSDFPTSSLSSLALRNFDLDTEALNARFLEETYAKVERSATCAW